VRGNAIKRPQMNNYCQHVKIPYVLSALALKNIKSCHGKDKTECLVTASPSGGGHLNPLSTDLDLGGQMLFLSFILVL
jgi:hypothetical protein